MNSPFQELNDLVESLIIIIVGVALTVLLITVVFPGIVLYDYFF